MTPYCPHRDSYGSWLDCMDLMRLVTGLRQFRSLVEMYRMEAWGMVP